MMIFWRLDVWDDASGWNAADLALTQDDSCGVALGELEGPALLDALDVIGSALLSGEVRDELPWWTRQHWSGTRRVRALVWPGSSHVEHRTLDNLSYARFAVGTFEAVASTPRGQARWRLVPAVA